RYSTCNNSILIVYGIVTILLLISKNSGEVESLVFIFLLISYGIYEYLFNKGGLYPKHDQCPNGCSECDIRKKYTSHIYKYRFYTLFVGDIYAALLWNIIMFGHQLFCF